MKLNALIVFFALFNVSYSCGIHSENEVVCMSLEELYQVDSPKIWEIIRVEPFEDEKLYILNSSVFKNIPNAKEIRISANNIQDILPETFNNLPNIEIISITGNKLSTINSKVFTGLPLQELTLTNNKIQFIENRAFAEMGQLKTLKLNKNELSSFDARLLLGKAPSIELLVLNKNHLKSLSKDIFDGLTNLKYLYLNNNQLDTLATSCFHNLKSLKTLDISSNNIKEISPKSIPQEGSQTLKKLLIHNNHLCFLHPEVLQRLPNIREFSYGGNPWQCPCWELLDRWITDKNISRICHEEYAAGQRPECIITVFAPRECVYDKERLNEVPNMFMSETEGYGQLTGCMGEYD